MTPGTAEAKHNRGVAIDVRVGQSLMIGSVRVTVERKTGQIARLRVAADESVVIRRSHPLAPAL